MWPQALKELNRENYEDFPHLANKIEVHLSAGDTLESDSDMVPMHSTKEEVLTNDMGVVLPSRHYTQFESFPESNSAKLTQLRKLLTDLIVVSVNRGNDARFKIAHCRMLQAISECEGPFEDTGLAPPTVHNRKMSGKSLSNKSSLDIGMRAACGKKKNGHSNKKTKTNAHSIWRAYTK